jgi:hypothetical protein
MNMLQSAWFQQQCSLVQQHRVLPDSVPQLQLGRCTVGRHARCCTCKLQVAIHGWLLETCAQGARLLNTMNQQDNNHEAESSLVGECITTGLHVAAHQVVESVAAVSHCQQPLLLCGSVHVWPRNSRAKYTRVVGLRAAA